MILYMRFEQGNKGRNCQLSRYW